IRNNSNNNRQSLPMLQQREKQSYRRNNFQDEEDDQNQQEEDRQSNRGDHSDEEEQRSHVSNDLPGQNPEEDLATVLQNLDQTMRQVKFQNGIRETYLVSLPTFGGGEQDPLAWLHSFHNACIANNMIEERRLDLLPVYLKGIAYTWWMEIGQRINLWDSNTYPDRSFTHCFRRKWCTPHQKSR